MVFPTCDALNAVELRHGNRLAWICPSMGGNAVRLRIGRAELLRTPPTLSVWQKEACVYGTPLLLPPNRIADGQFTWHGRSYSLEINEPSRQNHIHGYLADAPFIITERRNSESGDQLTLRYDSTSDVRYADQKLLFSIELTYLLDDEGLHQTICLQSGSEPLPLGLGQHTALCAPFLPGQSAEQVRLEILAQEEWQLERERIHPTGKTEKTTLCLALQEGSLVPCAQALSALFTLKDDTIFLSDIQSGAKVSYRLCGYPFLMLWNQNGSRSFVCCEPQTWLVNAPHLLLPPEQSGFQPLVAYEERQYQTHLNYYP